MIISRWTILVTATTTMIDILNVHDDFTQDGYSIAIPRKLVTTSEGGAAVPRRVSVRVASVVRLATLER
jgi:hypothetical protein